MNYYNEFHPPAAAILRGLIADKLIPEGHVDDRSITDLQPSELAGYTQCHFFAGIGGWPLALTLAGWPTDRPVWTGSCPCQPFSSAGKQKGKSDERHLWPAWFRLIKECRPTAVFGEQVASAITHGWLDEVADELEGEGYAIGSAVLPACSVGAPHRRDRLWFVANAESVTDERAAWTGSAAIGRQERNNSHQLIGTSISDVADLPEQGFQEWGRKEVYQSRPEQEFERCCPWDVADPQGEQAQRRRQTGFQPKPAQYCWENTEWLTGADGKSRPVMPGVRLLANGFPERVACLHGFGNAIVPQVAAEFIEAYMNIDGDLYVEVK